MANEILSMSLKDIRTGLDTGKLSYFELNKAYTDRSEGLNSKINAFISLEKKDAILTAAKKLDSEKSTNSSPLRGVPIAIGSGEPFCVGGPYLRHNGSVVNVPYHFFKLLLIRFCPVERCMPDDLSGIKHHETGHSNQQFRVIVSNGFQGVGVVVEDFDRLISVDGVLRYDPLHRLRVGRAGRPFHVSSANVGLFIRTTDHVLYGFGFVIQR